MQEKFAATYFANAAKIIREYRGDIPLHHFLKNYFAQNKKFGSKDRKYVTSLCYAFYRTGHAFDDMQADDRLKISFFLCCHEDHPLKIFYEESWVERWNESAENKIGFIRSLYTSFHAENIFPWADTLSAGIDSQSFSLSHLIQPLLFLRIRPGRKQQVLSKLAENNIAYKKIENNCIALENTTQANKAIALNRDAVVQDQSSQRIGQFMLMTERKKEKTEIWDCCAASGGKSMLAYDTLQNISLTVSDIRPSILSNLKKRFSEAGIKNYRAFVADLSGEVKRQKAKIKDDGVKNHQSFAADVKDSFNIHNSAFSIIICDVPCSGSGTWGRTPEQLYFFNEKEISSFSSLQKKITGNAIQHLKQGGYFLYITCSVFRKENEEVAEYIKENFHLRFIKMEVLKGYTNRADTMFAALFIKE